MVNKFKVGEVVTVVELEHIDLQRGFEVGQHLQIASYDVRLGKLVYWFKGITHTGGLYEHQIKAQVEFTLSDIKPGYVVETRDGVLHIAMNTLEGLTFIEESGYYFSAKPVDEVTLTNTGFAGNKLDIMKVYGYPEQIEDTVKIAISGRELIWSRPEKYVKELTMKELTDLLGYEVKIVK